MVVKGTPPPKRTTFHLLHSLLKPWESTKLSIYVFRFLRWFYHFFGRTINLTDIVFLLICFAAGEIPILLRAAQLFSKKKPLQNIGATCYKVGLH